MNEDSLPDLLSIVDELSIVNDLSRPLSLGVRLGSLESPTEYSSLGLDHAISFFVVPCSGSERVTPIP